MPAFPARTFFIAASRRMLVATISLLIFVLGGMTEYARGTNRDNQKLALEKQEAFQRVYSDDVRDRLTLVEAAAKRHSEEITQLRESMKEYSRVIADHSASVRELALQVRQLSRNVAKGDN